MPDFSRVLVVDDEEPMRHMLHLLLTREGYDVVAVGSGEAAVERLDDDQAPPVDVVLTDVRMPGMGGLALTQWAQVQRPELTIIVMSAFGSIELAIDAMKKGAYDYISKPFKQDEVVLTLRKAQERQRLRRENAALRARLRQRLADAERLGALLIHSAPMRRMARTVRKVAAFKTTVLLLGESGVGKELAARALHDHSPRREGPFVAVNCGAIPEALLESELFGHRKGAFTDASSDKSGLFEEATGGTLFLDEIGELPPALQVKLLRALQEGEIRRVGDNRPRVVDVRVVAATSRDLSQMVDDGEFRQDLYYRLAVMPVQLPPLRERKDDVPPLVEHFVASTNARLGTRIEGIRADTLDLLLAYDWPGNVRELENTIEHAAVMAEGPWIEPDALPERTRSRPASGSGYAMRFPEDDLSVKRAQRAIERDFILRALERTGGNRTHAAKLLDLSHRALLYKIKEFGF
ncbi:MAG: sigma-54 dependent transcriptional regulator [Myxococcota bacterium]